MLCQTFGVSQSWATQRKLEYLNLCLLEIGDRINSLLTEKNSLCLDEVGTLLFDKHLKKEKKEYRSMERRIAYWRNPNGKIGDEDIEKARQYPIQSILGIKRKGNISCPFHNDKHPSASIKNNKLHCFTCNQTWDTIDIIQKKEGLGFIEAVKYLIRG